MRPLTFEGFLKKYVRELSYCKSNSLTKLSEEANEQNPRLREPLLLYAFFTYKRETIRRLFRKNYNLMNDYNQHFLQFINSNTLLQAFEQNDNLLSISYQKVYKSYLSNKNRFNNDNHTKLLMKKKITMLQNEKKITDYRLYTDLHINPGNFNAFMKHECLDKLSLESTRKVLMHLENCPAHDSRGLPKEQP